MKFKEQLEIPLSLRNFSFAKKNGIFETFFNFLLQKNPQAPRKVFLNQMQPKNNLSNKINSQKYNIINFIPSFLLQEFKITLNIIYLAFTLFNLVFMIDPEQKYNLYFIHLIYCLIIDFVKDFYDMFRSFISDKRLNSRKFKVIQNGQITYVKSQDLKVGNIILLEKGTEVPVDVVILKALNQSNQIWIKTDLLDGNMNSQIKYALANSQNHPNFEEFINEDFHCLIEQPSNNIYQFTGYLNYQENQEQINIENVIWKNSTIEQGQLYAQVIYIGKEMRINWGVKNIHYNVSLSQDLQNKLYMIQLAVFLFFTFISVFVVKRPTNNVWKNLNSSFIYYANLLSFQIKVFVDIFVIIYGGNMNNNSDDIKVRNGQFIYDLGRIEYLLIDKTGTLTHNIFTLDYIQTVNDSYHIQNSKEALFEQIKCVYTKIIQQEKLNNQEMKLYLTILGLLTCNEVYTFKDQDNIFLKGTSQEDICLVEFLQDANINLQNRTKENIQYKDCLQNQVTLEIIKCFELKEFKSQMGIIIRDPLTKKTYFFIKGRSNEIISKLKCEQIQRNFSNNSIEMNQQGLRTLVMGYQEINENVIDVYQMNNQNFEDLTCIGLQNKLQEDIKATIFVIKKAGIKTWLVSGDDPDTLKAIMQSFNHKDHNYTYFDFKPDQSYTKQLKKFDSQKNIMILNGNDWNQIYQNPKFLELLWQAIENCEDVCFTRFNQDQKGQLACWVKEQNKIVCGVGDAQNDIMMIKNSNIGVCVEQKDMSELSEMSDFKIKMFKDLKMLIIQRGRQGYQEFQVFIHLAFFITFTQTLQIFIFNVYINFSFINVFTNSYIFLSSNFLIQSLIGAYRNQEIPDSQIYDYSQVFVYSQKQMFFSQTTFLWILFQCIFIVSFQTQLLFQNPQSFEEYRNILFILSFLNFYFVIIILYKAKTSFKGLFYDIITGSIIIYLLQGFITFKKLHISEIMLALTIQTVIISPLLIINFLKQKKQQLRLKINPVNSILTKNSLWKHFNQLYLLQTMYNVEIRERNRQSFRVEMEPYQFVEVLKKHIQTKSELPIVQQRLEYEINGNKKVLKNEETMSEIFGDQRNVILTLKNLGPQISYLNLFLIEYSGPLVLWIIFFMLNCQKLNSFYITCTLLVVFHYSKRLYESKFVHIFSNETAPLIPSFRNFIFYWFVFGVLVPLEIFYWRHDYYKTKQLPKSMNDLLLIFLFVLFEFGNFNCHMHLRKLRLNANGEICKGRKVPKGLFFDNIISPNYSFEILSWLTFVLISQSIFAFIFIAGGATIMYHWGKQKKSKLLNLDIPIDKKREIQQRYIIFPPFL